MFKGKKENPKKELIIESVCVTIFAILSLVYGFIIIHAIRLFMNVPSEDFTVKLLFMGIIVLFVIYKVFLVCIRLFESSLKDAKEAYDKIKQ